MRLTHVQVTNFRSIDDSTEFSIGDVTCLVGKNESGKTTVLQALERLNPALSTKTKYDKLQDYPRRHWADYDERHINSEAKVLTTKWKLEPKDIKALEDVFGPKSVRNTELKIEKFYADQATMFTHVLDEAKVAAHLAKEAELENSFATVADLFTHLTGLEQKSEKQKKLHKKIQDFRDQSYSLAAIDILHDRLPTFLYFANYSRMSGDIAIDKMLQDKEAKKVSTEDALFVQFLEYAGTSLNDLKDSKKFEELRARIEAASNKITERVFEYWSQNEHLAIEVTVDSARSGDPAPFNSGTIVRARVRNDLHKVTVPFSDRSTGFVWFFSFLVAFAQTQKQYGDVIILLDEPGHGLHGKAQADLLRFIDEKLKPNHQVIYSTHSPFMVPADRLDSVRIVEDRIERKEGSTRPVVLGTKVSSDFLSKDADTVFPLQAALGYEITQTLFVGKNTLLVEGPSDILYLQAASAALKKRKKTGLDPRWTICPSGGIDKIWPFVSLFSGKKLNVAVLTDFAAGVKKNIEKLKSSKLLGDGRILAATDFVQKSEADTEDFFEPELWVKITNEAYSLPAKHALKVADMKAEEGKSERFVILTNDLFNLMPDSIAEFDHFTPAAHIFSHPEIFADDQPTEKTLERFEKLFKALNAMLPTE